MLFLITPFLAILYFSLDFLLEVSFYSHRYYKYRHTKILAELFSIILLCALTWLLVFVLKKIVCNVQRHAKVSHYDRHRNNILIGLGFTMMASIFVRLAALYDIQRVSANPYFIAISANIFASFYIIFILGSAKKCKWDLTSSRTFQVYFCIVLILNFILIYIPAVQNTDQRAVVFHQIVFGLIGTSSCMEILTIFLGKLRLRKTGRDIELMSVGTLTTATRKSGSMRTPTPMIYKSPGGYWYEY
ncbi:unnamed protein product [Caenorhabditis brenneri]